MRWQTLDVLPLFPLPHEQSDGNQNTQSVFYLSAGKGFSEKGNLLTRRSHQYTFLPPRRWLSIFLLLGFILVFSMCFTRLERRIDTGVTPRRLAGDKEDEKLDIPWLPGSPALEELCALALDWQPVEQLPSSSRLSPLLVEEVLKPLDSGKQQQQQHVTASAAPEFAGAAHAGPPHGSTQKEGRGTQLPHLSALFVQSFLQAVESEQQQQQQHVSASVASGFAAAPHADPSYAVEWHTQRHQTQSQEKRKKASKRLSPFGFEEDDETSGPSWKVPRYLTHAPPKPAPPPTGAPSSGAPSSGGSTAAPGMAYFSLGQPAALRAPDAPSTAAPSLAYPLVQQRSASVRQLPVLEPGVRLRNWNVMRILGPLEEPLPYLSLSFVRSLLKRQSLNSQEAEVLLFHAEALANHMHHRMKVPLDGKDLSDALTAAGIRFLVLNVLHSAAFIINPNQQPPWWSQVTAGVSAAYDPLTTKLASKTVKRREYIQLLAAAIEKYKRYEDPGDEVVRELKRILFFAPLTTSHFKDGRWNLWREDLGQ